MTARQQLTRAACSLVYAASRHDAASRRTDLTADALYAYWYWKGRHYGVTPSVAAADARLVRESYTSGEMGARTLAFDVSMARRFGEIDAPVNF